jgi:hypothetical protein
VPANSRWQAATEQTRTTAKWIITSLAAAAAVVFGAGPIISKPNLSWQDDTGQLIIAGVLGVAGIGGIVWLISIMAKVLMPMKTTVGDAPQELIDELNSTSDSSLPSDANTYAEFLSRIRTHERQAANFQQALIQWEVTHQSDDQQTRAIHASLKSKLAVVTANRDVYRAAVQTILDRIAFTQVNKLYTDSRQKVFLAAALAAVGGLGFQLALSAPAKEDKAEAAPAASPPAVASLVRPADDAPGKRLWDDLGLSACEVNGRVPVLRLDGAGTDASPYRVTTVEARQGCQVQTFNVTSDLITLQELAPRTVTVVPAPSSTFQFGR